MNTESPDNNSSLWDGATFMPHDLRLRTGELAHAVNRKLQNNFLAFNLWVAAMQPSLSQDVGLLDYTTRFQGLDPLKRQLFVEYPLFRIWLKSATRSVKSGSQLKGALLEFKRVWESFENSNHRHPVEADEGKLQLLRFHPDRLILRAPQKDYSFPDASREKAFEETYPLSLFADRLNAALQRVELTWSDAYRNFFNFVKVVVDLVDYPFTSYSSRELPGMIFVSAESEPLLFEEDLIHEFGHQILDNVMELDRLVVEDGGHQFKLPWSGRERGIYGYFHAFFIYILLANYYSRIKGRSAEQQTQALDRSREILDGLHRAIPELEAANLFTPSGERLFLNLRTEVIRLAQA